FNYTVLVFLLIIFSSCSSVPYIEDPKTKIPNSIPMNIQQLCKTWISFEKTTRGGMNIPSTYIIDDQHKDTISFLKNGTFIMHGKFERRSGLWELINDSTVSCNINSPVRFNLISDSILMGIFPWVGGKEGEHDFVKYKASSN